ncbi:hypothetical protein OQJ13_01785 [Legionella sp. PATHC035]|uniref:hypothetical protein n=1 Tax=Legionella sp. PATHC035 TaxID=2992040 RepID=UPI002242CFE5|nr:hypothetical protein [Legionella sp. PATHC035]MCW8407706.1 hypothetical protein [Legionella sp. PATHC035]
MSMTLTEWWTKLDQETREVAKKYAYSYPDALTPANAINDNADLTPWEAVHAMASLGSTIESISLLSAGGIAGRIATASKKLGEPLQKKSPDEEPHYVPKITDEKSLLLAVVYYRSQCRFQHIQSINSTIQNGALGKPGIEQNKPGVAKEAEALRVKIKDYCSNNIEIATSAHSNFIELFPPPNELGNDLFKPKSLAEQYQDFAHRVIAQHLDFDIEEQSHEKLHNIAVENCEKIRTKLQDAEAELKTLYLYKKLKEFITNTTEYSDATFARFADTLDEDYGAQAKEIWDQAESFAKGKKSKKDQITEGVNNYTPAFLQGFMHARLNPLAYVPWVMGVDENARFKRFKEHFESHVTSKIASASHAVSGITEISEEDLKAASSGDILDLITMGHDLRIEIERLQKSIQSYVETLKEDELIKFSTRTPFIGWITKLLADFPLTKGLLHDNIHYLDIANKFSQRLDEIKQIQDSQDQRSKLDELKNSIRTEVDSVKKGSHYLLFQSKRELAHKHFHHIIDARKIGEEEEDSVDAENEDQPKPNNA